VYQHAVDGGDVVRRILFEPAPLPPGVAPRLEQRLCQAHAEEPFSPVDARRAVSRVVGLLDGLPLRATVYRGGLDLRGAEVDHLWVALGSDGSEGPFSVLDVAFPLFDEGFVAVLRRFVAGDAQPEELDEAGRRAGVDARVIGDFPPLMRYLGQPVWKSR
jgi:hypothetical protein